MNKYADPFDRFTDCVLLAIIIGIIVLKCTGVITISWFWLLCPLWGLLLIGIILAVILTIMCLITTWINDKRRKNKE